MPCRECGSDKHRIGYHHRARECIYIDVYLNLDISLILFIFIIHQIVPSRAASAAPTSIGLGTTTVHVSVCTKMSI